MTRRLRALAASMMIAATVFVGACDRGGRDVDHLTVTGSTTIQPIAEVAAEEFGAAHPDVKVLVAGVGSSAGIESVSNGTCDIGTSSRELKDEEMNTGLFDTPVAFDGVAVVVNPGNPVRSLTLEQIAGIFEGKITNWSEVGGPDMAIGLVNRDEASGTREAFWKIVLEKRPFDRRAAALPGTGQVRAVVAESQGAVGYISYGFVDRTVRAVVVGGVRPSERTIGDKTYPIARVLHFFTKGRPTGTAKAYIDFVTSPRFQDTVVRDAGFVPVNEVD